MELDLTLSWQKARRAVLILVVGVLVIVIILRLGTGALAVLRSSPKDDVLRSARTVAVAYLNGDLAANPGTYEDRLTHRLRGEVKRLAAARAEGQSQGWAARIEVERIIAGPHVLLALPEDNPAFIRISLGVLYRTPQGLIAGTVVVDMVRGEGGEWLANAIHVQPAGPVLDDGRLLVGK